MTTVLPSVAALELTYRCNHACRFCSCPWFGGKLAQGREMPVEEWKRLVDVYARAGVRQFSLTGGEALLKEGCLEIASDTSVEHLLGIFGKARELGCPTTVGVAVTKLNLPELYETISAALVAGAGSLLINRFLPGGRGLSHPELMLTAEEVRHAADIAEEVLSRAKRYGHFGTELPACLIDAKRYRYLTVTTGCSAATDFFAVGPNGRIRVCNHSPVELLRWDEWERLPTCGEWMHYIRHDYLPTACTGCASAAKCLGGCREAARAFSGLPTDPDPLMKWS